MDYLPRFADAELQARLSSAGAVVIEGAKAVGKTATAQRQAGSVVFLDTDLHARAAAELDPSLVLEGETPRLIDEWQTIPAIWNHIRRESDERGAPGQFILTGSAVAADDATRHTGAGRISRVRMRTLSLHESDASSGAVTLSGIMQSQEISAQAAQPKLPDLVDLIIRGGWPATIDREMTSATRYVVDYLEEMSRTDIVRVDNVRRDPTLVRKLLRSLARNTSTEATLQTLATDIGGSDAPLGIDTTRDYLSALERLFIVENQPAWSPNLRSKSILRKAPKRHFIDPSLAVAALRADRARLLEDLNLLGLLFESLVVRDLRIYASANDATVSHYRDNTGLEVDALVEAGDGKWAAFEIKLGGDTGIDDAAASLLRFRDRVDTSKIGDPAKLAVIVGTGYAYEREDGIAVVPITHLGA
jgi:hypothetical protein